MSVAEIQLREILYAIKREIDHTAFINENGVIIGVRLDSFEDTARFVDSCIEVVERDL
jgi:hypothetical protein